MSLLTLLQVGGSVDTVGIAVGGAFHRANGLTLIGCRPPLPATHRAYLSVGVGRVKSLGFLASGPSFHVHFHGAQNLGGGGL